MTRWHSLYCLSEHSRQVIEAIEQYFIEHHYTVYNPFGDLPGMSYPRTIKLFLAPPHSGWIRILVDSDANPDEIQSLAIALSVKSDCLSVRLDGANASIEAYSQGKSCNWSSWSQAHLKDQSHSLETLIQSANENSGSPSKQIGSIPLNALPADIQAMAQQINTQQANQLFNKMARGLLKATGHPEAQKLIKSPVQWESPGGRTIQTVMERLTIPENWREPDFASLRRAYTILSRKQSGSSIELTGDNGAIRAVPSALEYISLYGGKID